jgi:serine/threonine protein kinase
MASAVDFVHRRGIAHLDLSLENVLLDCDDTIKVCDFGMARRLVCTAKEVAAPTSPSSSSSLATAIVEQKAAATTELLSGKPGKIGYMAAEVYAGQAFDGYAADVWSLGVMLFMILTGIPPWKVPCRSDERYRLITTGHLQELLHAWNTPIDTVPFDLLSHMLCPPSQRWTMQQVLTHAFVAVT